MCQQTSFSTGKISKKRPNGTTRNTTRRRPGRPRRCYHSTRSSPSSCAGSSAAAIDLTPCTPSDITLALADAEDARKTCVYDFEILKVLGGGSFCRLAIVSRTHKATGITTKFAVKIMSTNGIPRPGFFSLLNPLNWILPNRTVNAGIYKETLALKSLIGSPFSAGYACAKMARDSVYYFLDIPQGNTLKSVLVQNGPMEKPCLRFVAAELVSAIQDMHEHGMTCGDFDPDTVVIGNNGHVKLMTPGLLSLNIEKCWTLPQRYTSRSCVRQTTRFRPGLVQTWFLSVTDANWKTARN